MQALLGHQNLNPNHGDITATANQTCQAARADRADRTYRTLNDVVKPRLQGARLLTGHRLEPMAGAAGESGPQLADRCRSGVPHFAPQQRQEGAMFLDRLSAEEQKVYCQLAYAVMAADGDVADKELAFHDRCLRGLGIDELPEPAAEEGVLVPDGAFRLAASRKALLVELALLAVTDGEVTGEERSVLDAVASEMDFDSLEVDHCLEYAGRLRDVLDEGSVLLAEGN